MYRTLAATFVAISLSAQDPAGYAAAVHALPTGSTNVLVLPDADTVWFTGTDLIAGSPGGLQRTLLHFGAPVFGSFTVLLDGRHLLFAEGSTHDVWLVPLHGGTPRALARIVFAYDAVAFGPGRALISAKTGGFGTADNEVVLLDVATGQVQPVLQVPGASGPVAMDANGDVWYATASLSFPTPPGTTTVLRWTASTVAAAIATGTVLGTAQATTMASGLDSAGDLEFDSDGDLLFVDWYRNQVGELDDIQAGGSPPKVLLDYATAGVGPATLQFVPGVNGQFEPYAPDAGQRLFVHETTFGSTSQIRRLTTRRATANVHPTPIPAGPFTLTSTAGPASGLGLVAITAVLTPGEHLLAIPGFEQTLPWNGGMAQAINTHLVAFDGHGAATLMLLNPGFPHGLTGRAQVAFFDSSTGAIGSTAPVDLQLGN
ncbi:MAG: hypothetical protein IPK26_01250 [Planctomycetes bacterium]|nr:hypothetical protein [Planctomycetota bacterium]